MEDKLWIKNKLSFCETVYFATRNRTEDFYDYKRFEKILSEASNRAVETYRRILIEKIYKYLLDNLSTKKD